MQIVVAQIEENIVPAKVDFLYRKNTHIDQLKLIANTDVEIKCRHIAPNSTRS